MIQDGTYDVFVVDAALEEASHDGLGPVVHLDLTVTMGEHKGEVISVAAQGLGASEVDLIGMPATLTVTDGQPSITIDS